MSESAQVRDTPRRRPPPRHPPPRHPPPPGRRCASWRRSSASASRWRAWRSRQRRARSRWAGGRRCSGGWRMAGVCVWMGGRRRGAPSRRWGRHSSSTPRAPSNRPLVHPSNISTPSNPDPPPTLPPPPTPAPSLLPPPKVERAYQLFYKSTVNAMNAGLADVDLGEAQARGAAVAAARRGDALAGFASGFETPRLQLGPNHGPRPNPARLFVQPRAPVRAAPRACSCSAAPRARERSAAGPARANQARPARRRRRPRPPRPPRPRSPRRAPWRSACGTASP